MRFILFLLFTGLVLPLAGAADKEGNYAVWGPGGKSCYSYSKAREAGDYSDYKYFIMGYLTAYNTITDKTYRISGNKNLNDILAWLDEYCEPKGVHGFEQAVASFIIEHHKSRLEQPVSRMQR